MRTTFRWGTLPKCWRYVVASAAVLLWASGATAQTSASILQIAQSGLGNSYWWGNAAWGNPGGPGHCSGNCGACSHTGQNGADCSGFVAKAWQLDGTPTTQNSHPFATSSFIGNNSLWTHISSRSTAQPGDAFVYNNGSHGHIVIYVSGDASGTASTYQASGCAAGILAKSMTLGSAYELIRRAGVGTSSSDAGADAAAGSSCTANGVTGQCMAVSACNAMSGSMPVAGLCPGSSNIQCCIGSADASTDASMDFSSGDDAGGSSCTANGVTGQCMAVSACNAMSGSMPVAGLCPGPTNIQCCIGSADASMDFSSGGDDAGGTTSCTANGVSGQCMAVSACNAMSGSMPVAGLCPGPTNIQCCIGAASASSGSVCSTDDQCTGSTPNCCDPNNTGTAQCSATPCATKPATSILPTCDANNPCSGGQNCCDNDNDGTSHCTAQACATAPLAQNQCSASAPCPAGQTCDPGSAACVSNDGGPCTGNGQCPTGDTCNNNICSSGQAGSACSPSGASTQCAAGLTCDPTSSQCSTGNTSGCTTSSCGDNQLCDLASGQCQGASAAATATCANQGDDCTALDCCDGLSCDNTTLECVASGGGNAGDSGGGCVGDGSDCSGGQTCCDGLTCDPSSLTCSSGGACANLGDDCSVIDCCSALTCDNGSSTCVQSSTGNDAGNDADNNTGDDAGNDADNNAGDDAGDDAGDNSGDDAATCNADGDTCSQDSDCCDQSCGTCDSTCGGPSAGATGDPCSTDTDCCNTCDMSDPDPSNWTCT